MSALSTRSALTAAYILRADATLIQTDTLIPLSL